MDLVSEKRGGRWHHGSVPVVVWTDTRSPSHPRNLLRPLNKNIDVSLCLYASQPAYLMLRIVHSMRLMQLSLNLWTSLVKNIHHWYLLLFRWITTINVKWRHFSSYLISSGQTATFSLFIFRYVHVGMCRAFRYCLFARWARHVRVRPEASYGHAHFH